MKKFDNTEFTTNSAHHIENKATLQNDYIKFYHATIICTHCTGLKPINKNDGKIDEVAKNLIKYPDVDSHHFIHIFAVGGMWV